MKTWWDYKSRCLLRSGQTTQESVWLFLVLCLFSGMIQGCAKNNGWLLLFYQGSLSKQWNSSIPETATTFWFLSFLILPRQAFAFLLWELHCLPTHSFLLRLVWEASVVYSQRPTSDSRCEEAWWLSVKAILASLMLLLFLMCEEEVVRLHGF